MKNRQEQQITPEMVASMRRAFRNMRIEALRDGRRTRAIAFTPKKGKGSYTRRPKHANADW